jgi:hypothetical protein
MKIQIVSLQLEGISQTWWDTQLENYSCFMDRGDTVETQTPHITTWDGFSTPTRLLLESPLRMVATLTTCQLIHLGIHRHHLQTMHRALHYQSSRCIDCQNKFWFIAKYLC